MNEMDRKMLRTIGLAAIAVALGAVGCRSDSESPPTWRFVDRIDATAPPGDTSEAGPTDADDTSDDVAPCPSAVQPRDGTCNRRCASVDPDCADCPDPSDPNVRYAGNSYRDPGICRTIDYSCREGWRPFHRRRCGCGCRRNNRTGPCAPMEARGEGNCRAIVGYKFDGDDCVAVSGCNCDGPDCDKLYGSRAVCERATGDCDRTCGNPGAPTCDDAPDLDPRDCPRGTVYTVDDCRPECVDPETCEPPGPEGCAPNDPCEAGEWCDYPDGKCGDGARGECRDRPVGCPQTWNPVCGCDGTTYTNACEGRKNGADFQYKSPC